MSKRSSSIPRIRADLSEETVQAFRQALELRDHREAQLADDKHCDGVGRCEVCDKYERLVAVMDGALGVRSFELSPIDVFDAPAPPMWTEGRQAEWDRARARHLALAEAAGVKPRQKGLLTDGCRAHLNVRWCERYGRIPDGPVIGKPFRLQPFQREIIYGVYADPEYWRAVDAVLKKRRAA